MLFTSVRVKMKPYFVQFCCSKIIHTLFSQLILTITLECCEVISRYGEQLTETGGYFQVKSGGEMVSLLMCLIKRTFLPTAWETDVASFHRKVAVSCLLTEVVWRLTRRTFNKTTTQSSFLQSLFSWKSQKTLSPPTDLSVSWTTHDEREMNDYLCGNTYPGTKVVVIPAHSAVVHTGLCSSTLHPLIQPLVDLVIAGRVRRRNTQIMSDPYNQKGKITQLPEEKSFLFCSSALSDLTAEPSLYFSINISAGELL